MLVQERQGETYRGAPTSLPWYAVRVRSNFERRTAAFLTHRGYEQFLAEYVVKRYGRPMHAPRPLLPGYVFCRLDPNNRLPVLASPGVIGIVSCGRVPLPIEEEQIERVRTLVQSGLPTMPCPFLNCGDAVVLQSGPLVGLRGILLEIKSLFRIVVSIDLLQRSIAAEIERDWVRPAEPFPNIYNPHLPINQLI